MKAGRAELLTQQTRRDCSGSAQIGIYAFEICRLIISFVAPDAQAAIVAAAHAARRQAKRLLEAAKRAVEVAIEEGEAAALAYLETF